MAVEVGVLLQFRVAVAGQHLAVGVDIDALAGGLFQEHGQILQVMAGDEDGLALLGAQGHFRGDRVAVGAGVAAVQEFHGLEVDLAALHAQADEFFQAQLVQALGQGALHEFVHALVLAAQDSGVVGVGGDALEAVDEDLLQGAKVLVGFQGFGDIVLFALGDKSFEGRGRGEGGGRGGDIDAGLGLEGLAAGHGVPDQDFEAGRVEIDVGQGREDAFVDEAVQVGVGHALGAGLHGHFGQPLQGVDEKILESGHFGLLAAHADFGAAGSFGSLFTLVAKHEG
ncbi:hypothetical protein DSECCO2_324580 [anaerobic digester metagenome]